MKKYLKTYVEKIDKLLENEINDIDIEIDKHLTKIKFFQHERLIHLLVTLAYAIITMITLIATINEFILIIIAFILICFLITYVLYYFWLEKNVQYLYKQYDRMLKIKEGKL